MTNARFHVPPPRDEPHLSCAPGAPERRALKGELARLAGQQIESPLVIGGREVRAGRFAEVRMPHRHGQVLARCRQARTNDKAGSPANLMRWISPRAIREGFVPPLEVRFPCQEEP